MAVHRIRARDKDPLAQFLGWFSVGLGLAQVTAPRVMSRLVGSSGDGHAPLLTQAMGLRELTQGMGILIRPRATSWLWSRVAGDSLDLALLGVVAARNKGRRGRGVCAI